MAKNTKNSSLYNGGGDDPRISTLIKQLRASYQENPVVTAEMIEHMKNIRTFYIEYDQPTIVKSIRLACEHVTKYKKFDPMYLEENSDISEFEYYLDLIAKPANKYNRDEIKELNILLKDSLEDDSFHSKPRRPREGEDTEEEEESQE